MIEETTLRDSLLSSVRICNEITNRGRWKSDRSVLRYEPRTRPHKPFHQPSPEMRKRVAQSDLRPLHLRGYSCFSFGEPVLPEHPRGAYFVVLSNACCKVGRRIRQRGFLVGWYDLTFLSPRISAGSVPMLGVDVCLAQCFAPWTIVWPQNESKMVKCLGSETSPAACSVKQCSELRRVITFIRHLQKMEIPWILSHPLSSHVWRTSPVCLLERHHHSHSITFDQCAFGTPLEATQT